MRRSERVTAQHLARTAMLDMRQSTPQHVLTHQERLRRHYALQPRALTLGWRAEEIDIIDTDVGLSAAAAQHREGFKAMVTQVTRGEVGIILSSEVTRLSRNCSDGYPLLEICGYRRCVIADRDGVDDPASATGRVWLGLTGQLSEMARPTIRARLTAGLLHKAQRGE